MSCRGVHFAIDLKQMKRLFSAYDDEAEDEDVKECDEAVLEIVNEIEEAWDREHLFETDKAWEGIYRCLAQGDSPDGCPESTRFKRPLEFCIFGSHDLYLGDDYSITLLEPEEVREVAAALKYVTEAWMREQFFQLDEEQVDFPIDENEFEYTWGSFRGLPEFFARAAEEGRAVVFSVDY